jgi:hypothetical protein
VVSTWAVAMQAMAVADGDTYLERERPPIHDVAGDESEDDVRSY